MHIRSSLLFLMFAACSANDPSPRTVTVPPGALHPVSQVPGGGNAPGVIAAGGTSFTFTGPLAPGSASFVGSPVTDDPNSEPTAFGTGAFDITINAIDYNSSTPQTIALMFTDPDNNAYVELASFVEYTDVNNVDTVSEVAVIVKQSDFVVGGSVALDGVDRVALFATGPAANPDPALVGAAVSGTVTFTAGTLANGNAITASVDGSFGQIDWVGGGGGGGGGGGTSMLVAGNYTLGITGPAQVYCDGSLAGHEADFNGITAASLHLDGGAVALALRDADTVTLDGSVIASDFGATPLVLDDSNQPPALFVATTNESGSGPNGTSFIGRYLALDGTSATPTFVDASAGGGYTTADESGTCTVSFTASLTQ